MISEQILPAFTELADFIVQVSNVDHCNMHRYMYNWISLYLAQMLNMCLMMCDIHVHKAADSVLYSVSGVSTAVANYKLVTGSTLTLNCTSM